MLLPTRGLSVVLLFSALIIATGCGSPAAPKQTNTQQGPGGDGAPKVPKKDLQPNP